MAEALTAIFRALVRSAAAGDADVRATWSISAPLGVTFTQTLTQGATSTVTVPSGAALALIIPPTNNTLTTTLLGDAADVGVSLSPSKPTLLALATGLASFKIKLSAGTDKTFTFSFI